MIVVIILVFVTGLVIGLKVGWDLNKSAKTTYVGNVTITADREDLLDAIEAFDAVEKIKKELNANP